MGRGKGSARQNPTRWTDAGRDRSGMHPSDDQLSRELATLLRYYREHTGLIADSDGFVAVSEIMKTLQGKGKGKCNADDIIRVAEHSCSGNHGKRFELRYDRNMQGYGVRASYDHAEKYPSKGKGTGQNKGHGKGKGKGKNKSSSESSASAGSNTGRGREHWRDDSWQTKGDHGNSWDSRKWSDQRWDSNARDTWESWSAAEHDEQEGHAAQPSTESSAPAGRWRSAGTDDEPQPWVSYSQVESSTDMPAKTDGVCRTAASAEYGPSTATSSGGGPSTATSSGGQEPSFEIEHEYEALEKHAHQPPQAPERARSEVSNWKSLLGDDRRMRGSRQQDPCPVPQPVPAVPRQLSHATPAEASGEQDQQAEPAAEWETYVDADNRRWFFNGTTNEWFFEDQASDHGWVLYKENPEDKGWWWHEGSQRHFYPKH